MKREFHTRKIKFAQEEQKTIFIERSKMKKSLITSRKFYYKKEVRLWEGSCVMRRNFSREFETRKDKL